MRSRRARKTAAFAIASVAASLGVASCGGGSTTAPTAVRALAPTPTTTTTSEAPLGSPSTTETTTVVATTMTVAVPTTVAAPTTVRLPKVTVPAITVPTVPPTVTIEAPLPVPELFDAVQGIGTPCAATEQRPDGCWLFVYATVATRDWTHHIHSDAATGPWVARDHGQDCGSEAQPHHREREGCSFYLGPVHGRVAGQRECLTATTVMGGRESEHSDPVCFTWTDHQVPAGG